MLSEQSDHQLITQYQQNKDVRAFEMLVRRHYDMVRRRLLSYTKNDGDADDLSQILWIKVLEHLPTYQNDNKFEHFINRIATNLLRDRWRKLDVRKESSWDELEEQGALDAQGNLNVLDNPERQYEGREQVEYLTKLLIPQLPVHLRTVFLLKHESEYWDNKQPFLWQHLADLNNMSVHDVWAVFQSARDKLVISHNKSEEIDEPLTEEEMQVFLVWTQTQRLDKTAKYTEQYFADMLNIPVNTFKTHYRKAIQLLHEKMSAYEAQAS